MTEPDGAPRMSRIRATNYSNPGGLFNSWEAILDADQTIEDAREPRFWVHLAERILAYDKKRGRGDLIRVVSHDYSAGWLLQICEIGPGFIKTFMLVSGEVKQPVLPEASTLEWKFNAATRTYDVRRKDGYVLSPGHQSKAAAKAWIDDNMKAMSAAA